MYNFEKHTLENVNKTEYENFDNKCLFSTVEWLNFLKDFRHVKPVILRISDDCGNLVGYFTAGIKNIAGIRILGSPFYGWMGQHMGFDLADEQSVKKSILLDELVRYIAGNYPISMMMFSDFKFDENTIDQCRLKFYYDAKHWTYFLDITRPEEVLFKNFKSGYRTCVRKFEKLGGTICEDQSESFIAEHRKQLIDVFARKNLSAPDYTKRLRILFSKYSDMVLAIKALDADGNNIASSYYVGGGKLAFFASNASLTDYLYYNANQALMWYAIKYWKSKGIKTLDLGGRADYKANFGSVLYGAPAIVWAKHKWVFILFTRLRDIYYGKFEALYKIKSFFRSKESDPSAKSEKARTDAVKNQAADYKKQDDLIFPAGKERIVK